VTGSKDSHEGTKNTEEGKSDGDCESNDIFSALVVLTGITAFISRLHPALLRVLLVFVAVF
jgi:hypothetical protein